MNRSIPFHKKAADALKEAIKNFGTYSYLDKGPEEVMDFNALIKDFKALQIDEALTELKLLAKVRIAKNADAGPLIQSLMFTIEGDPQYDAFFDDDELMEYC